MVAEADERRWQRRAELADEERRSAELDERIDRLPFTLREASRAVDDLLNKLLVREGVTDLPLTSVHVLVLARHSRPIVALAHQLRVSPQAVGRMVKDLAVRGLVDVGVSPLDSRARLVAITPAGEQLLSALRRQLFVTVTVVSDAVGEDRLVALADELADIALVEAGPKLSW